MPIIKRQLSLPYSAADMYALVNKVEDYAEFLPWCKESQVLSRTEDEVRAKLTLTGGGFQKSFTTCNRLQPGKMIEIRLVDGPFRQLEGFWLFEPRPEGGSQVSLHLDFEFSNRWLALAFGPFFYQVANALVEAFEKRAQIVYGPAA